MCGWVGESGSKERERMEERRKQAIPSWEYISRPPVIKKSASPRVVTVVFFFLLLLRPVLSIVLLCSFWCWGLSLCRSGLSLSLTVVLRPRPLFFLVIFPSLSSLFLLMAIYIYGTYMLLYRENKEYKKRFSCLPERGCQRWQPFLYKSREFFSFFFWSAKVVLAIDQENCPEELTHCSASQLFYLLKRKKKRMDSQPFFFCFVFVSETFSDSFLQKKKLLQWPDRQSL